MSSNRRVLWHLPNVGKFKCLKKDPSKTSFWIEGQARGEAYCPDWINIRDLKVPNLWLQLRVAEMQKALEDATKLYARWKSESPAWTLHAELDLRLERAEFAVNLVWAELARRAEKPWLAAKPSKTLEKLWQSME